MMACFMRYRAGWVNLSAVTHAFEGQQPDGTPYITLNFPGDESITIRGDEGIGRLRYHLERLADLTEKELA